MPDLKQIVQGRLVDGPTRLPMSGVTVRIFKDSEHILSTTTTTDGLWKASLGPGKYTVKCFKDDLLTTQTFLVGAAPVRKFTTQDYRDIREKY